MRTLLITLLALAGCDDGPPAAAPEDVGITDDGADLALLDAAIVDATPVDAAPPDPAPVPYPPAGGWPPETGPGGPAVTFAEEALYQNCAFLDVGPDDITDHRNMVTMYDGYLMMPWSPEFGITGGLTFFDVSDPCAPQIVGHATTNQMRESHTVGFSDLGGRFAVTAHQFNFINGGALFWDVSDPSAPAVVGAAAVPDFFYPDAYARVTLSTFWQAPYVYLGNADNGVYIVDATDPTQPELVGQHLFEPIMRVGQVQVVGNLLVATAAEGTRVALLDVGDPAHPQPIPGGDFTATDHDGVAREWYFSSLAGGLLYLARKEDGGGLIVWDIRDPTRPIFAGAYTSPRNGGYVFVKDHLAFVGESSAGAIYDVRDPGAIEEVAVLELEGDLDTVTPIGNMAVISVDDKAARDQGTAIAPFATEPDATPPHVTWVQPADGATGQPVTTRVGLMFNEFVAVKSAWLGSIRIYEEGADPGHVGVEGHFSVQESIVNFWPKAPLARGTTYRVEVPVGGIADFNGNRLAEAFTSTFTTVGP